MKFDLERSVRMKVFEVMCVHALPCTTTYDKYVDAIHIVHHYFFYLFFLFFITNSFFYSIPETHPLTDEHCHIYTTRYCLINTHVKMDAAGGRAGGRLEDK